MEIYDITAILNHAIRSGYDIAPDRMEWVKLCHALKLLGYDETFFVALSSNHGTPRNTAARKWREEKKPRSFLNENTAPGLIVNLAKSAGIDVKQFFADRWENREQRRVHRAATPPPMKHHPIAEPKPEPLFVPAEQVKIAAGHFREASLYFWLCKEFDPVEVDSVLVAYRVGASKYISEQGGRAVCYPYIDTAGRCVDCKIMHHDPTTGSRKTAPPVKRWTDKEGEPQELKSTWALAELKQKDLRADWCNFGDHLLAGRPNAEVCLVESEKTALIASIAYGERYPDKVWIAVGSKNNLKIERCRQYRGHKVVLYPDRDGYENTPRKDGRGIDKGWRFIAAELAAAGLNVHLDTAILRYPGEPKDDLADIVLRSLHGKQEQPPPPPPRPLTNREQAERAFEEMKQRYPAFAEFAEKFELEPISVEPYRCKPKEYE